MRKSLFLIVGCMVCINIDYGRLKKFLHMGFYFGYAFIYIYIYILHYYIMFFTLYLFCIHSNAFAWYRYHLP